MFIINNDGESPLGYLPSSDKRKVEIPGNLLLKYKWDQCYNTRGVAVRCQEGGERMRKSQPLGRKIALKILRYQQTGWLRLQNPSIYSYTVFSSARFGQHDTANFEPFPRKFGLFTLFLLGYILVNIL